MEQTVTIMLPVDPVQFGIFLGILVVICIYYVVKFIVTAILGG